MRKYSFTLVEVLIVLTIIGLLFGIIFQLSRDRIDYLYARMEKENTIDAITQTLQQIMTVKWYEGKQLQSGGVLFTSGGQNLKSVLVFSGYTIERDLLTFRYLKPELTKNANTMEIIRIPYNSSCDLFADIGNQRIKVTGFAFRSIKNHLITYCFSVDTFTCKIREVACER